MIAVPLALLVASAGAVVGPFPSPDGSMTASVVEVHHAKDSRVQGESILEIHDSSGTLMLKKDYSSADGEHGSIIDDGKWSANSEFFLYSLESSGGHSPWHLPVDVFVRRNRKAVSLDKFVGAITGGFEFVATTRIKAFVMKGEDEHFPVDFNLERLWPKAEKNPNHAHEQPGASGGKALKRPSLGVR